MNTKTTISITEARKNLFDIAEEVQKPSKHYMLTEKGRAKAVIMSAEEYESMMETIEVEKIFPNLDKDIKKAEEEYRKGECITLDEYLAKQGYSIAEKPKKKYEAHRTIIKKRAEKSRKNR